MTDTSSTPTSQPPAAETRLREAARAAHDTLIELNPSNYSHDDVCEANNATVEAILLLADALVYAAPQPEAWTPIESAPKDGEPVLIWKPDERMVGEYMMAAYWDDEQGGWVPVGGIHTQGYFSEVAQSKQGYPTHWMPLPEAPASGEHLAGEGQ